VRAKAVCVCVNIVNAVDSVCVCYEKKERTKFQCWCVQEDRNIRLQ
jgi:hypothetical protein